MVLSPEQSVFAEKLRQQDGDPAQSTTPNSAQRTVVSILLFLLLMGVTSGDLTWVIAATVTIVIHELGHFLGMKLFGTKMCGCFWCRSLVVWRLVRNTHPQRWNRQSCCCLVHCPDC